MHARSGEVRRVALLVWVVALFLSVAGQALAASPAPGLGGGMTFAPGSVFPFPVGATSTYQSNLLLQSTYPDPLQVKITTTAPDGVQVRFAAAELVTLPPGPLQKVPFTIGISPSLTPGHYRVIISVIAPDPPRASGSGVTLAPAFATDFWVDVVGASATVTLNAVSKDDGRPITGLLTLFYAGSTGQVHLGEAAGSTMTATIVPGDYLATFVIDGLVHDQQRFSVAADEQKTVTFTVAGVQFVTSGVKAATDGKACTQSAELVAIVRNSLAEVKGPVTFTIDVGHDGETVETVTMATLPVLPVGDTTQQWTYHPTDGFAPGAWTFHLRAGGTTFSVASNPDPSLKVAACGAGGLLGWIEANPVLAAAAGAVGMVAVFLLLILVMFLLLRRRRRAFVVTAMRLDASQHLHLEGWWKGTDSRQIGRLAVSWEEVQSGRRSSLVVSPRLERDPPHANGWWATGRSSGALTVDLAVPGPAGAPVEGAEVRVTVTINTGRQQVALGSVDGLAVAVPAPDVRHKGSA